MIIKRQPLKFFLLVFALSLPLWIIETLIDVKGLPLDIPATDILAAFTPLIAACILVSKEDGRSGVKKLLKRIFDFSRIKQKKWYAPVIFLPLLLFLLIYGVMYLMGMSLPTELHISFFTIPFLFVFFFLGAVGEEVGYMGYAVDSLQERWGAIATGIIIGLPWAIWHYPSILQQGHGLIWILWGTLGTIAMRILIIWIYNNTGKSLFAAILFHTLYNVGRSLFPKDAIHNPLVDYPNIHYLIIAIIAGIIVFVWGSKTLARYRYIRKI
ncbi:MAG: CPBP family intramembrane metalloprotease [Nitrospirae bacterium]|nr:CPBP family intramembrane metalloprotease [Nitrospirota bacterium]